MKYNDFKEEMQKYEMKYGEEFQENNEDKENNINNKKYVGKTNFSVEKRFAEHIKDSKKKEQKKDLYIQLLKNME
jgi:hypothetical protein